MKNITIQEFLNLDNLNKIRTLKEIAAGNIKLQTEEESEKMPKVNVIETRVKEILEYYPNTRENDNLLYVTYLEQYHYIEFNKDTFINYEEHGLPSFKSIERARRKIQNEQNSYKASEDVENMRREAEQTYKQNYAR